MAHSDNAQDSSTGQVSARVRAAWLRRFIACSALALGLACMSVSAWPAPAPDDTLTVPGATGPSAVVTPSFAITQTPVPPGTMTLFRATDGSYRDPVLLVEGLDPSNANTAAKLYDFGSSVLDPLRAAGRSVWILLFGDSGGAIAANARLVSSAIAMAAAYGPAPQRVSVVGLSLGGVAARWALAEDEATGGPSSGKVDLFMSLDAPQQGVNANPNLQELVQWKGTGPLKAEIASPSVTDLEYETVTSWGTQPCSVLSVPSSTRYAASTAAHDWFYKTLGSLNGDGYPHKCRKVAIANGSMSPNGNAGAALYELDLQFTGPFGISLGGCGATYQAMDADVAPGSLVPLAASVMGSKSAAGFTAAASLQQPFLNTFVPTVSALDIHNGVSAFDSQLTQVQAVAHNVITDASVAFALKELGPITPAVPGDTDGDGKVTLKDATLALRFALGIGVPTRAERLASDLKHAGSITIADVTLILQKAVGL